MISHESIRAGKDEKGVYFIIAFTKDLVEKIYVDEFFESQIKSGKEFTIEIGFPPRNNEKKRDFYNNLPESERERLKKELDLKSHYPNPDGKYNQFRYHLTKLKTIKRELSWNGNSISEHQGWAQKVVNKLKNLIHYQRERIPLNVSYGAKTSFKDIILQRISFDSAPGLRVSAILARPAHIDQPLPAIIALHGHNKGKINAIGLEPSKSNSYYGIELALRGFVTLSLDQWGWGERVGKYKKLEKKPEEVFSRSLLLFGETALGIRAWDVTRAIDFLETLDYTNGRFGIIGQSGGGATSTYASAIEPRIEAAAISGHFCAIKKGLLGIHHCTCAYVPHMFQFFDIPDIVATRAPKPTFIISGEYDPIFPKPGVLEGFKVLENVYNLYDKRENLGLDIIPGKPHYFRGDFVYPWLEEKLELNQIH